MKLHLHTFLVKGWLAKNITSSFQGKPDSFPGVRMPYKGIEKVTFGFIPKLEVAIFCPKWAF